MGTPGDKRRFLLRQGNRFVQSEQLLDGGHIRQRLNSRRSVRPWLPRVAPGCEPDL
jgi:hypothetical protein